MSECVNVITPFGAVSIVWCGDRLERILLGGFEKDKGSADQPESVKDVVRKVRAYFGGEGDVLTGIVPVPDGTPFQMKVWEATVQIGYGETVSYGEIGMRVGVGAEGARAVGAALNRNPLPLIVPCHRVVAANGDLTGFASGLGWKRALLGIEMAQFSLEL